MEEQLHRRANLTAEGRGSHECPVEKLILRLSRYAKSLFWDTSTRISLEQCLNTCHKQRVKCKGHQINDWQLTSLYNGWGHPPTIPSTEVYKKISPSIEASPMISAWHLCHAAIDDTMGHTLGHQGDLTVKIFSIVKFSFDQEGRLGGSL